MLCFIKCKMSGHLHVCTGVYFVCAYHTHSEYINIVTTRHSAFKVTVVMQSPIWYSKVRPAAVCRQSHFCGCLSAPALAWVNYDCILNIMFKFY